MTINNKSISLGTTGYDCIDRLSMEDRLKLIEQRKQFQQSLTPERRTELWSYYYDIIKNKKREYNGRLKNVPADSILQEYFNEDVPKQLDQIIKDVEQECNQIIDPIEQAKTQEYAKDLIAPLLVFYKYREREREKEEEKRDSRNR